VDWAYVNAGVKYSFGLELRDQGQTGFMLPISQVRMFTEIIVANEIIIPLFIKAHLFQQNAFLFHYLNVHQKLI
jgi:hypothetical protein